MSGERDGLSIPLSEDGEVVLFGKRLRDGRIALGTKRRVNGEWLPGELHLLERRAYLALAGWLAPVVEDAWLETVRQRQAEPLDTAHQLYGDAGDAAERLAAEMLRHLPPALLRRALLLLVNSIGPDARARLVERLNRTADFSEDAQLRRQLAAEEEALAYAVAAAALFDAVEEGHVEPGADGGE